MTRKETEYRVTLFGKQGAEKWVRHAYNIPPHVGVGWTPYRVLVTASHGSISHTAFVTFKELKRWLDARGYSVKLQHHGDDLGCKAWVARFGSIWAKQS